MTHEVENDPSASLSKLLGDIVIPMRPKVMVDLMKERTREEPDFKRIQEIIKGDVGMSAAMIKAASSPLFGGRSKVSGVGQAVTLLGLKNVMSIATGVAMRQAMKGGDPVAMERFWDSAEAIAIICGTLARKLRTVDPDEAYTFGLFHDCGIPLLTQRHPEYKAVLRDANGESVRAATDVEDERIGTNHTTVGYFLSRSWMFSDHLCEAIRFHHDLDTFNRAANMKFPAARALIALGHCAEHIQHMRRRGTEDMEWLKFNEAVLEYLGLGKGEFDDIAEEILAE